MLEIAQFVEDVRAEFENWAELAPAADERLQVYGQVMVELWNDARVPRAFEFVGQHRLANNKPLHSASETANKPTGFFNTITCRRLKPRRLAT